MKEVPVVREEDQKICQALEELATQFEDVIFMAIRSVPRKMGDDPQYVVTLGVVQNEHAVAMGYGMLVQREPADGLPWKDIQEVLFPVHKFVKLEVLQGKVLKCLPNSKSSLGARSAKAETPSESWLSKAKRLDATCASTAGLDSSSRS
jgi:hypothetical protein